MDTYEIGEIDELVSSWLGRFDEDALSVCKKLNIEANSPDSSIEEEQAGLLWNYFVSKWKESIRQETEKRKIKY
ncbi:MAG: hypothetical protein LBP89_04210 [Helicobacteraceae bacterium]|nr:hypothetical protein [Helicobacteraceae bacterium]